MKKYLVMKIGGRINTSDSGVRNGNAGENRSIIQLYLDAGHDVTIITNPGKKDNPERYFGSENVRSVSTEDYLNHTKGYDEIVVINGTTNFFGGIDGGKVCELYHLLNLTDAPISFYYTDPVCALKQVWTDKFDESRNKKWGTSWTKEDLFLSKKITMISALKNINLEDKQFKGFKNFDVKYFEFQKSVIFGEKLDMTTVSKTNDLVYGGFFRGGARKKFMEEYFFDTPYSSKFFGKIKEADFKDIDKWEDKIPQFKIAVGDWDHFKTETSTSYASIVFGEESYQGNVITMRVFAIALSGTIILIDDKYDPEHKIFTDPELQKITYVKNKQNVDTIIQYLKSLTVDEYEALQEKQFQALSIDKEEYMREFKSVIE